MMGALRNVYALAAFLATFGLVERGAALAASEPALAIGCACGAVACWLSASIAIAGGRE